MATVLDGHVKVESRVGVGHVQALRGDRCGRVIHGWRAAQLTRKLLAGTLSSASYSPYPLHFYGCRAKSFLKYSAVALEISSFVRILSLPFMNCSIACSLTFLIVHNYDSSIPNTSPSSVFDSLLSTLKTSPCSLSPVSARPDKHAHDGG